MITSGVLSADQAYEVRKSFALVERQSRIAALVFYQRLFELDPALRPMFKTEIEEQADKLMEMLAGTLNLLEKTEALEDVLEQLGARHVGYGVKTIHYQTVGTALIEMLERVLGPELNQETRDAWLALYEGIATAMLRGAASVSE